MTWKKHAPFVLILLLSFVVRLYLSGWNSYWYDELLSVKRYGTDFDNLFVMIDSLANNSVHPPLYQGILFGWIKLFGDVETTTRLLSNLYISGATVFVYALTLLAYNQRVALFSALLFVMAYDPLFYGLEARSYAQTLFLSTASSYVMYRLICDSIRVRSRWFWLMSLLNLALLLTHYYNGVFIVAQAAFLFLYTLHRFRKVDLLTPILTVGVPLVSFLILWGPQMTARYQVRGGNPQNDVLDPITIFITSVLANVNPLLIFAFPLVVGLWIFLLVKALLLVVRRKHLPAKTYFYLFLLSQVTLIPIGAYFMTFIGQFTWRYIIYFVPSFLILLAIITEQTISLINTMTARPVSRFYLRHNPWVIGVLCLILVFPAGYRAATSPKDPWREVGREIVGIVENNPVHHYLIYEAGPRESTYMDYYFARWSDTVRVTGVLTRGMETEEAYLNAFNANDIARADFMIVFFLHDELIEHHFVLDRLCDDYGYFFSEIVDEDGYIIFDLNSEALNSCPAFLMME